MPRRNGRPALPAGEKKGEIVRFRAADEDVLRCRRLAAKTGECDSEVLREGLRASEREHDPAHGGAVRELLGLLRARDPAAAVRRLRELLGLAGGGRPAAPT